MGRWVIFLAVLAAAGGVVWVFNSRALAAGVVEGEILTVRAPAAVLVRDVFVEPGQPCTRGQPLVRLVARQGIPARRVLEAQYDQAQLRLTLAEHGAELDDLALDRRHDARDRVATELRVAQAAARGAEAEWEYAEREAEILARLHERRQGSARELDAARTAAMTALEKLGEIRAQIEGLEARWQRQAEIAPPTASGAALRETERAFLQQRIREADQRLRDHDERYGTRTVLAPFAGRIDRVHAVRGDAREKDEPLVTLYDPDRIHVIAYVKPKDRERFSARTRVTVYPEGSSSAVAGVVSEVHEVWARIPAFLRSGFGQQETAITIRVDADPAQRGFLAPNMVVRVVARRQ